MNTTFYLIKRNMLLYLRDCSAVFFSFLSMIILVGLMVLFLGRIDREGVLNILSQHGGVRDAAVDKANASELILKWTIAGILVINSLTVSLTLIGYMVRDEAQKRMAGFYVAPVKRVKIAISYIASAVVAASAMCIVTLIISQVYLLFKGVELFSFGQSLLLIGIILVNVMLYSGLFFVVALFVHSESAWSALGTIIGTLVGFVGATYLPMGMLPKSIQTVLACLPILHGNALMRQVCTDGILQTTFSGLPAEVISQYKTYMGISVEINDKLIEPAFQVVFLLACGIIAVGIAGVLLRNRTLKEC